MQFVTPPSLPSLLLPGESDLCGLHCTAPRPSAFWVNLASGSRRSKGGKNEARVFIAPDFLSAKSSLREATFLLADPLPSWRCQLPCCELSFKKAHEARNQVVLWPIVREEPNSTQRMATGQRPRKLWRQALPRLSLHMKPD